MAFFKICPNCQRKNTATATNCANADCDFDLFGVQVTQISEDAPRTESRADSAPTVGRKCTGCGTVYPLMTPKCPACMISLSASPIVPIENGAPKPASKRVWQIVSVDQKARLSIAEGEKVLVGRAHELAEYLGPMEFVGRKHALFIVRNGQLYIVDKNSTNGVQVNFSKIEPEKPVKLDDGDMISLGGIKPVQQPGVAYFYVHKA